jgi:hypothetical protein
VDVSLVVMSSSIVAAQPDERVEELDVEAGAVGESGIVDIASRLGVTSVTVMRSNL